MAAGGAGLGVGSGLGGGLTDSYKLTNLQSKQHKICYNERKSGNFNQ